MSTTRQLAPTMIAHIVRKDWRLLWPLGAVCALLQGVLALLEYRPESFAASDGGNAASMIISLSIAIGLVLTILLVVHQEALPGVNQDWLVRPIKRRDLLLAKVVFVILVVHAPIVAVHWVRGMAEGLPAGAMLRAALLANLELALLFSLPVLTLAALSKSVTEALVTALASLVFLLVAAVVIATIVLTASHSFHLGGATDETPVEWIVGFLHHAVLILTAAVIVGIQYYRRDTRTSRIVLALGLLLFVIVGRLPWRPAFALQESLSSQPEAGRAVALHVTPSSAGPANDFALEDADAKARREPVAGGRQRFVFGMEVQGLPPDAVLHADRVAWRLVDAAGDTVSRGTGQDWDLRGARDGTADLRQVIDVPKNAAAQSADRHLRLELDYSLTLLTPRRLPALPAIDGDESIAGLGRCASRLDEDGTGIEVGCDSAGEQPPCFSVSLARGTSEPAGPEAFFCDLDYVPAVWRFSVDPIDRFVTKLSLEKPSQALAGRGPDAELRGSTIVFRVYEAVAHFSRHVTVNELRARDVEAAAASP